VIVDRLWAVRTADGDKSQYGNPHSVVWVNWIELSEDLWGASYEVGDREGSWFNGGRDEVFAWARSRGADRCLIFSSEVDDWVDLDDPRGGPRSASRA
jgi:hypothetical protein